VLVRFGGLLFLVALAVWLYCVLDAATADREQVRLLPKGLWVAIVVLTLEFGAIAWLLWGRPRGSAAGSGAGSRSPRAGRPRLGSSGRTAWPSPPGGPGRVPDGGGGFGRVGRPAPDDDPEFLARLDRQAAAEHEKLLGSWEADLRRREEELREDPETDEPEDGDPPARA
jgi:hypothetical protein